MASSVSRVTLCNAFVTLGWVGLEFFLGQVQNSQDFQVFVPRLRIMSPSSPQFNQRNLFTVPHGKTHNLNKMHPRITKLAPIKENLHTKQQ